MCQIIFFNATDRENTEILVLFAVYRTFEDDNCPGASQRQNSTLSTLYSFY